MQICEIRNTVGTLGKIRAAKLSQVPQSFSLPAGRELLRKFELQMLFLAHNKHFYRLLFIFPLKHKSHFHHFTVPQFHRFTVSQFHCFTVPLFHSSTVPQFLRSLQLSSSIFKKLYSFTVLQFNNSAAYQFYSSTFLQLNISTAPPFHNSAVLQLHSSAVLQLHSSIAAQFHGSTVSQSTVLHSAAP